MATKKRKTPKKKRRTSKSYQSKKRQPTDWLVVVLVALFTIGVGLVLLVQYHGEQMQARLEKEAKQEQLSKANQKQQFIKKMVPYAQKLQTDYHVLPSITLAQAILESDWGKSTLAADYHNYFGIKGDDPANTKEMTTKEYLNGQWITTTARFRVYDDYQASMLDHVLLFAKGTTWNPNQYQHVIAATDYQQAANALKQDGYATDPDYPAKLIEIVKTYQLNQYDQ
ncbi:Mannosyl-glycoendo-beta-N-acetylglucosaminidase family protein [Latilactobacillus fuchuensis]|uniref:Mannosyl-glycoendo-beta-N-acetylglucosaminidase family protein n=1 Tax=Latilactobacillus fuchuensis TaxID=164393 RepID=A0A2N9DX83_9LACO|nr:glycoside hydrolase family 73 protein [Latilactobacillus fuchuensis]MCP8856915.1 glycoside hydrolase family 73 protein [Latilactobacillus fuchuensis]SPC39292.1 Mannosyl-glycoendo-beta-N-acetylglucosaminidase family protein [Latilactobacillus fuchuensis]